MPQTGPERNGERENRVGEEVLSAMRTMRRKTRRWAGVLAAGVVLALAGSPPARDLGGLPSRLEIPFGETLSIPWSPWLPVSVEPSAGVKVRSVAGPQQQAWEVSATRPGTYQLSLKWFGWIPFKKLPVKVITPARVVPGGQSIGVVVHTEGVVVVGYNPVLIRGTFFDPAEQAGIAPGDVLLKVNGRPLTSDQELRRLVQVAGRTHHALVVTDRGPRQTLQRYVSPLWNQASHQYQIGITVKDTATGVGTLTFWQPGSLRYAALGHSITDGLTRRPVRLSGGNLMGAQVVGLVPGTPNSPGEKVGVLAGTALIGGQVTHNGIFGLDGRLAKPPLVGAQKALPVALPDQVKKGPAQIITVLHGQAPQAFRIQILQAYPQVYPATKGILFKVTDPRLLAQTGGVVQGMSGSPILQNGRLVGAVTHVLVSRPDLGYGCYAEWMAAQPSLH